MTATQTKPSGLRRFTAADQRAKQAIEAYDAMNGERTPSKDVLVAFKRAARPLGFDYRIIGAIDQLAAFTQEQDWQGGPITVWPSNEKLMRVMGLAKRSVQDLMTYRKEAGLIAFVDSPTGARYGRRDGEGRIVEAYGIDLRPLASRVEEFTELADQEDRDEAQRKALRRHRTILKKAIHQLAAAAIEAGGDEDHWEALALEAQYIADDSAEERRLPALLEVVELLEALYAKAEEAFSEGVLEEFSENNSSTDAADRTPNTNTTKPQSLQKRESKAFERKGIGGKDGARTANDACGREDVGTRQWERKGPEGEPRALAERQAKLAAQRAQLTQKLAPESVTGAVAAHFELYRITPNLVLAACPTLKEVLWGSDPDWRDIVGGAHALLDDLGISQHAWGQACLTLSREGAAVAVSVIAEKHRRGEQSGEDRVKSPGGYLRWLTKAAKDGVINLGPKLYGLRPVN